VVGRCSWGGPTQIKRAKDGDVCLLTQRSLRQKIAREAAACKPTVRRQSTPHRPVFMSPARPLSMSMSDSEDDQRTVIFHPLRLPSPTARAPQQHAYHISHGRQRVTTQEEAHRTVVVPVREPVPLAILVTRATLSATSNTVALPIVMAGSQRPPKVVTRCYAQQPLPLPPPPLRVKLAAAPGPVHPPPILQLVWHKPQKQECTHHDNKTAHKALTPQHRGRERDRTSHSFLQLPSWLRPKPPQRGTVAMSSSSSTWV
jgi:hypothetical protein